MPFLLLSFAASRLLVSLLCVGFPCVRVLVLPLLLCPFLLFWLRWLLWWCVLSRFLPVLLSLSCVVARFVGAMACFLRFEFVWSLFGATKSMRSFAVSKSPFFCCLCFSVSLALVVFFGSFVCWLLGPLSCVVLGRFHRTIGPVTEPWTGLHCSELHWR